MNPFPSLVLPGPAQGSVSARDPRVHLEPRIGEPSRALLTLLALMALAIGVWSWALRYRVVYLPFWVFVGVTSAISVSVWMNPSGHKLFQPVCVMTLIWMPLGRVAIVQDCGDWFRISQDGYMATIYFWSMAHAAVWIGACGRIMESQRGTLKAACAGAFYWSLVVPGPAWLQQSIDPFVWFILYPVHVAATAVAAIAGWILTALVDKPLRRVWLKGF